MGSTPTVTLTPSEGAPPVTQTPTVTPSAEATAIPTSTPTVTQTPSPDVTATTVSSETASGDALPSSDETTAAEQPAETAVPGEVLPEPDKAGSGSWLFFGGVGLLIVGVALLLLWGRRGA